MSLLVASVAPGADAGGIRLQASHLHLHAWKLTVSEDKNDEQRRGRDAKRVRVFLQNPRGVLCCEIRRFGGEGNKGCLCLAGRRAAAALVAWALLGRSHLSMLGFPMRE